ncbi:serpin family protein [Dyadobacter sp. CY323]|uniref:serpin family protein n=1 Tax=Dyadobacter sp. CY323 TaxID=2907302 RepID=UPI001F25367C|nr:serpin family protein [Dyadobacter sp. CY323]MCE6990654.1 serpin family protein [Dyadobacter sp. CY323]
MKILKQSFFLPLIATLVFWSCTDDKNVGPDIEVNPVEIPANVSSGTTSFAFNLLHNLQQTQPSEENLFVSPLSLHIALGMLLNGAEKETEAEILKTLQMEGITMADLNSAYQTLINDLPVADSKVSLGLANSMWYRTGFQVENNFQGVLKNSFNSEITGLPFDNAAKDRINQWASDKTSGKIQKVLDKISPDQVMFLLNALYFKGDWKAKFDSKLTVDTPFTLEKGGSKTVKMMNVKSVFKIAADNKFSIVQLPYSSGQFNMTLIIPHDGATIDEALSTLTAAKWNELTGRLSEKTVTVGLPRFKLDYSIKLNETLKKMGIQKAFSDAADLGRISKSPGLFVDFVKQDTYLGIDEQGTEAAAVTTIGIGLTSAGPQEPRFICDRPFGLIISESTSNTLLFLGRIKNPDSK